MTTNQTERVPGEELDQMIWKLERDGMTPKLLSLMRELREVRRVKAIKPNHPRITSEELDDETLDQLIEFRRDIFDHHSEQGNKVQAIIHGVNLTALEEPKERRTVEKLNQPVSETERTHPNSFTDAELEMMAHGDNPQANAYRELLAFRRNSPGVPGCWIPCSERMPNVGEYVLCLDGLDRHGQFAHDDVYTAAYCDRLQAFTTEYYGDHDWISKSTPTHWAPIPKMPAAPQQEVKR